MNGRKTFSKNTKRTLFEQLEKIQGMDPKIWRIDLNGIIICFPSYGDMNSRYGWNIHHQNGDSRLNALYNLVAVSYETHNGMHTEVEI